jgi:hypothetical protein
VSGITEVKPNGQWSITGGTVAFASAHGTINFINSQSSTATDAIKELDIRVFHTPEVLVSTPRLCVFVYLLTPIFGMYHFS